MTTTTRKTKMVLYTSRVLESTVCNTKTEEGGFDCEFVEKPPKAVQSECPICLQILREPYQVSCCGTSFCKRCINNIKTAKKTCPTCNKQNFTTFHNKGLQRSLYEFQVYCSHKQEGCDWKGELGQLDNHLNLSPQPDKWLQGCKYSEIECIYCSESIKRCDITIHQDHLCPKRPFSCEYCHSYEAHYEDVIHNHWPVCGYHPVRCPNKCGKLPLRQTLEDHITRDCPKTVIDCDFHHVGCDVRLTRQDMPTHLKDSLVTHMSLQAASHSKLQASYTTLLATCNDLQNEVRKLKSDNKILKQQIGIPTATYVEFTMENFVEYKKAGDWWDSPPFYTHPFGYKFCLSIRAIGHSSGYGTHVSVFVHLMKGAYDDHLKFPFRGHITVQLVDQEGGEEHWAWTIAFDNETPDEVACRVPVTERERQLFGQGYYKFISHDQLKPKYLKNSCVCFRVTKITY